jgi:ADP-dependent NAD(P)H-hydrate dehydratase
VSTPVEVAPDLLRELGLPRHGDDDDKHARGTVCVLGGCSETPGAVLLAGLAALRAGGGRLRIGTVASCAVALAIAVPEARVVGLPERADGAIDPAQAAAVGELAQRSHAVLVGPGMLDVDAAEPVLDAVTAQCDEGVLVVDAGAIPAAGRHPEWIHRLGGRALLVPNPNELERLGCGSAEEAADRFQAVVAVRAADTVVATPDGRCFVDRHGTVGLATSGSGDVAAGLAAGLAARSAAPEVAAVWAAALHGLAGERLAPIGFLARELLDEVPAVLAELGGS